MKVAGAVGLSFAMVFAMASATVDMRVNHTAPLGVGLWRTYAAYVKLPQTASEAKAAGWFSMDSGQCRDRLGVQWSQTAEGPAVKTPVDLYFTPFGQLTGVGVTAYGDLQGAAVDKGFWRKKQNGEFVMTATFRDQTSVCSTTALPDAVGDRVVINADSTAFALPLTQTDAKGANFETGSCFASMGTHSFFDLAAGGQMTWKASNLMPVVPMYDRNNNFDLNAFFFATPVKQQGGVGNAHQWEPIALPNNAMCQNWCNSQCGWSDTSQWSTIHFYLFEPSTITCLNGCRMGCCE